MAFELDLIESIDGTADFDDVLISAHWPKLRVLRLRGVNCRVGPLVQFLAAHSGIEELALAQMMPGHAWTQLERDLPSDALPNLRHLECSSAQAAALLKYPRPKLHTLLGVEVHDTIVDSQYFSWDEAWEDEEHEGYDENAVRESPWKAMFLDRLKAQQSIRRLGISTLNSLHELEVLSTVVPQITELHIDDWDFQATVSQVYSIQTFRSLLTFIDRKANGIECILSFRLSKCLVEVVLYGLIHTRTSWRPARPRRSTDRYRLLRRHVRI